MRWPLLPVLLVASCDFLPACGGSQPSPADVLGREYQASLDSCTALAHTLPEGEACQAAVRTLYEPRWAELQRAEAR